MVKSITEKTGISQRSLAAFIDSTQSVISRYGTGGIYLQSTVFPQLLKIYTLSADITTTAPPTPTEEEKLEVQQAANWCRTQCRPLQKKLDDTLLQYQQAGTMLQLLTKIGPAPVNAAPKKQRWLDIQQYEATLKLQKYGWRAQHKLLMAIQLLQQQATLLETSIQ